MIDITKPPSPIADIRAQITGMAGQFQAALPAHISTERFCRVVMTSLQQNPELLECDRRSLWNAAMQAAQDGLLPDGREGAMIVRRDKRLGKTAKWLPMVAGIRKKARNSGEIAIWDAHLVHENDEFEFELGDNPFIRHKPALANPGKIIGAYSICTLKGGEKTREVMSISEIHEVRDKSDAWRAFKSGAIRSTPWSTDEGEMCRKTVARRHAKVIPMSSDLQDIVYRDDTYGNRDKPADIPKLTLADKLAVLAAPQIPPERLAEGHDPETGEINDSGAELIAEVPEGSGTAIPPATVPEPRPPIHPVEGDWPGDGEPQELAAVTFARQRGARDRAQGVQRRAVPTEYRESGREDEAEAWRQGWGAVLENSTNNINHRTTAHGTST